MAPATYCTLARVIKWLNTAYSDKAQQLLLREGQPPNDTPGATTKQTRKHRNYIEAVHSGAANPGHHGTAHGNEEQAEAVGPASEDDAYVEVRPPHSLKTDE